MKLLESIKLWYRANKYKYKNDKGGIAYINSSIQQGHTVFDIGAHKAGYLYWMLKRVGKKGKVFAFEPQANLYHYIKKIKILFKLDNLTIEHIALSDTETTATLFIPENKVRKGSTPGATIVENKEHTGFAVTEKVNTQTLDLYCKRNNLEPDFLKIDVEGNELNIFRGGVDTLKKYKPKILVEIEARHVGQDKVVETFEFMKALGYTGYMIAGTSYLPLTEFNFDKYQNKGNRENYCNNFIFEWVPPG